MMEVTVKTLDSQTRQFSVPEQITVKEFKERIAGSVSIPATTQRLIFCGRVLQDSKKLSEYDVNGRTIHLVEKPPPSTTTSSTSGSSSSTTTGQAGTNTGDGRDSFFMGAITVQADVGDNGNIHVQPNGSHMDVHINLGPINVAPPVSASQQRINQIRNLLRQVTVILERLENPTQQQGTQTESRSSSSGTPPGRDAAATNSSPPSTASTTTQTNQGASGAGGATPSTEEGGESQAGSNQSPNGQTGRRTVTVTHPRGSVMADILAEMTRVTTRLQPYLDQYRELLSGDQVFQGDSDRQAAHRLQTLVNQGLHNISHIYHAISDCMMDLHTAPPRVLRAPAGMMVAPIRPPGQMPVHVNIGPTVPGGAPANAAAAPPSSTTPTSEQTTPTTSAAAAGSTTESSSSSSSNRASTRVSSTSTTQTRPGQQMPVLTNAAVTLTNQQTFVLTPQPGAPGYVAVPISTATGNPAQAQPAAAGNANSSTGSGSAPTSQNNAARSGREPGNAGNQPQGTARQPGPHVHIHQLGLNPGSIPPAGLFQVMAQMVGQQQMQQMAQFPANHAGPTNTSSTPTTSSPRPQQSPQSTPSPPTLNQARPGPPMAFFNSLQPRPAWDPLLPCNSRHIAMRVLPVGPGGRGRAGAAGRTTGNADTAAGPDGAESRTPGGSARSETPAGDSAPPQPMAGDSNLSDMIGGLVGALFNQQQQQPFVQVMSRPQPVNPTAQAQQQRQRRQQSAQQSSTTSTGGNSAGTGTGTPGSRSEEPLSDQMLINMVMRMTQEMGAVGSGQASSQSLRQLLGGMGMTLEPGEGFLGEILNLVTQELGMGDFAAMFLGQPAPLDRIRPSLDRFVRERVMRGEEMTDDNVQAAVVRVMEELRPSVAEFIGGGPAVQDIDPVASHMKFLSDLLERFVRLFMPSADASAFGEQTRALGHTALHQWVALTLVIFGNRQNVDEFLSERLRSWFGGSGSSASNLVASMSMQNFDLAHRMLTVTPDQIQQFVVRRQPAAEPDREAAAEPAATPSVSGAAMETDQATGQSQETLENDQVIIEAQILVDEQPINALGAAEQGQSSEVIGPADMDLGRPSSEPAVIPVPMATPAEEGAVAMDRSGWEAAVPAEWVPVINQDIGRQRRQAPQGGLSDAYLAGMPPKRMKLAQDRKAAMNSGVSSFVPDTLRRATQSVGARPVTSMTALLQEAGTSTRLQDACEEQIRSAVQERLRRDPDFDPQRFPHADKYMQKKKK